jgi:hypothetical protein
MTRTDGNTDIRRRTFLAAAAGVVAAGSAGCLGDGTGSSEPTGSSPTETSDGGPMDDTGTTEATADTGTDPSGGTTPTQAGDLATWRTAELTDVLTGETFRINEFRGRPVLVETFAVWCPICTTQRNTWRRSGTAATKSWS